MSGISRAFGKRSSQKPPKVEAAAASRRRSESSVELRTSSPTRSPLQQQLLSEVGQKLNPSTKPSTPGPMDNLNTRNTTEEKGPSPDLRRNTRGRGRGRPGRGRVARGRGMRGLHGMEHSSSVPSGVVVNNLRGAPPRPPRSRESAPTKPDTPIPKAPNVSHILGTIKTSHSPVPPRKPVSLQGIAQQPSPNSSPNSVRQRSSTVGDSSPMQRANSTVSSADTKSNLWRAVRSGNDSQLKQLLPTSPDFVNSHDLDGDTPLAFAAQNMSLSIAKVLLEYNASPFKATTKGPEPIHIACEKGDIQMAKLLLEHNASIHARNIHSDKTPLHYAASSKSVKIVEWAIRKGADVMYVNRFGISPIYVAVSSGSIPITQTLLQRNADPNSPIDGHTLLHVACMYGFFRLGCSLIRSGADLDARNKEDKTPLELMKINPNVEDGFGSDPIGGFLEWIFHFACSLDEPSIMESVLRDAPQHFPLHRVGEKYCTESRLCEAVTKFRSMKVVACLVEHGAPVKVPEENLPRGIFDSKDLHAIKAVCIALTSNVSKKKKKLDLSSCNLHCLPEDVVELLAMDETFQQIRTIDLSHNVLRGLPPNLLDMPNLEKLKLEGNPLDMIPESFRKTLSWVKIREYLKTVKDRAQKWQTCKLLVVGQEGVGKTTLIRSMQSKHGKTQCKQNMATDGVDIKQVNFTGESDSEVNLMVWDLGGQEVFYPTHQFYLTANSVYIVAFDMAQISKKDLTAASFEGVESRISYWAYQIRELSAGDNTTMSPMFLVGTHTDQVQPREGQTREEAIAAQIDMLRIKFPKQRFPGLVDIVGISCKTGEGVPELRSQIGQVVKKKGFLPEVSQSWVKLHDFIQSVVVDTEVTSRTVLNDWARMCGVKEEQIEMSCQFLRDMGALLIFEGIGLENLVILNPRWLTNVMASLITFRHSWIKAGTLSLKDVPQVFKNYPIEMHETLLSLLEQFSIIFRINSQEKRDILVPSLLPEECRSSVLAKEWKQRQKNQTDEYGRIYRFPFLPLGFFGRIMVRVLHLPGVQGNLFWRYGMVIEYTNSKLTGNTSPKQSKHLALLEYDATQFRFSIRVRLPKADFGKNMLLQTLVDCVDTTLEEYCMRECAERLIPCTHCIDSVEGVSTLLDSKGSSPFLFSFAECVIAATEQGGHVFCNHIRSPSRMVPVDRLAPDIALSGIPLIDDKQLKLGTVLGRGGFGVVYSAEFQPLTVAGRYQPRKTRRNRATSKVVAPVTKVAVKELHCEDKVEFALMYTDFQSEVFVMSQMKRHPNIVRLHGVCLFPKPRMVLELLPMGDLHGFLHPKDPKEPDNLQTFIPPQKFPWKLRLLMALDIAKGMFVLHSQSPPIIHRDLRSPNIFLSSLDENASVRAKVADFGLARIVAPTVAGTLNTWQWLAPEVIGVTGVKGSKAYGISSDVYSFAIVCWEIATGGFPFDEFNDDTRFASSNANEISVTEIKNAIATDLRPTLPPAAESEPPIEGRTMPAAFRSLIEDCWKTEPTERPTFIDILDRLSKMCALNAKQQVAVSALQTGQGKGRPERASCRLTIDFTPLQLTAVFQQTATKVQYHSEYKRVQTFQPLKDVVPTCVALVDNVVRSENPTLWVGSMDGELHTWPTSQSTINPQLIIAYDRPIQDILTTELNTIWVCGLDGKMMIWDPSNCQLIREWNLRKNTTVGMKAMRTSADEQQIWVISPHCVHIYSNEQTLLHILNVSKKQEIRAVEQHIDLAWVAVGNEMHVYNIDTLELMGSWEAHKTPISAIQSVGEGFVWTSSLREIAVWNVKGMEIFCCKKLETDGDCKQLYFSNIDNRVWTSVGNNIIVWDPIKYQPLQEITGAAPGDELVRIVKSNFADLLFTLTRCGNLSSWTIN